VDVRPPRYRGRMQSEQARQRRRERKRLEREKAKKEARKAQMRAEDELEFVLLGRIAALFRAADSRTAPARRRLVETGRRFRITSHPGVSRKRVEETIAWPSNPRAAIWTGSLPPTTSGPSCWPSCSGSRKEGREKYLQYSAAAQPIARSFGAQVLYAGECVAPLLAAPGQAWDGIVVLRYPSRAAYVSMQRDPKYQAIAHLRREALREAIAAAHGRLARAIAGRDFHHPARLLTFGTSRRKSCRVCFGGPDEPDHEMRTRLRRIGRPFTRRESFRDLPLSLHQGPASAGKGHVPLDAARCGGPGPRLPRGDRRQPRLADLREDPEARAGGSAGNEAHHMGFTDDRTRIWAASLNTSRLFIFDVSDVMNPKLAKTIENVPSSPA